MSFEKLVWVARWEGLLFTGGLASAILYKLLTGEISFRYLLHGKRSDGFRYFSPERVQLLIATLAFAGQYVMEAAQAGRGQVPTLPDVSLGLLGASNLVYLAGKSWAAFRSISSRRGEEN